MKLKVPQVYAQRDPRWASILLGNNTNPQYTIGMYGCLITCFGMYIGESPDQVNTALIQGGGFPAGSGEFMWMKSPLLNLNQQVLSYRWTNAVTDSGVQQAQQLLDQGYPLLCEIDFNPATVGEEMHFVLCIGYEEETFYIADPWTGQVTTMDVYGGFRRAVIQFRTYDRKLPPDTSVDISQVIISQSDAFIAVCTLLNVAANKDLAVAEIQKLITIEDQAPVKDKQIQDAQTQIKQFQTQVTDLQKQHDELTIQVNTQAKTIQDQDTQIKRLSGAISDLQNQLNEPVKSGWQVIWDGIKKVINGK